MKLRPGFIVAGILLGVLIIALLQWLERREQADVPVKMEESAPEPTPPPAVIAPPATSSEFEVLEDAEENPVDAAATSPALTVPPQPQPVLPELAASDAFVNAEVAAWQLPEPWLQRSELLARASVVLSNAATGKIPARQVSFLVPADTYPVQKVGDQYFVDANGYGRYDPYIAILESVSPAELAAFLRLVDPLLVQALAQLGVREPPAALVAQALARIESVEALPTGPVELLRPSVMYTYADPALEALPDLDKQLLRIGPQNLSRLRAYLSEFEKLYLLE